MKIFRYLARHGRASCKHYTELQVQSPFSVATENLKRRGRSRTRKLDGSGRLRLAGTLSPSQRSGPASSLTVACHCPAAVTAVSVIQLEVEAPRVRVCQAWATGFQARAMRADLLYLPRINPQAFQARGMRVDLLILLGSNRRPSISESDSSISESDSELMGPMCIERFLMKIPPLLL